MMIKKIFVANCNRALQNSLLTICIISLLLLSQVTTANSKMRCLPQDLTNKNCYLFLDKNRLHIWKDKIFLNNLIARDTKPIDISPSDKFAAKLDLADWHSIKAKRLHNRWFLEMSLWGPPLSGGEVESLWWLVFEIKEGRLIKHLEKLIQKRKKIASGRFKYDKLATYDLHEKNKKIYWRVNYEKGSIE